MSAKTEKRILWAIAAVLVMAVIFAFSSQASFASEEASDAFAGLLSMEQQDLQTRVSNQSIIFGLTLRKLAHIFLFAALGFCLYQALMDVKRRLVIAVGTAYLYGVLDEIHQSLAGRYGRWQDTLIDLIGIALGLAAALLLPKLNVLCKKWFYEDWDAKHPVAKKRLEWCLDALSLAAVMQYVGYRFLQTTMFEFIYSELYKTLTFLSLLVFGGVRFVYLFARKLWADADEKAQIRRFLKFIGVCVLALPFFIVAYLHDYKVLIFIPICWMCLYDIQAELVFKWYVRVIGIMLGATVLCCLAGVVKNINGLYRGRFKEAYGIVNGTDFAAYFLFLLLYYWCGQKEEDKFFPPIYSGISIAIGLYLYHISESRTTLICCTLTGIVCLLEWLNSHVLSKTVIGNKALKVFDSLAVFSYPVALVLLGLFVFLFAQGSPWVLQLDSTVFSGRIEPIWQVFQREGLSLFGSSFIMHGNGASMLHDYRVYDFLDSGYAYMLLRFGIVITLVISTLWIRTTIEAIRSGKRQIAYSIAVISVYALSECQLVNINYNVILLLPFCAMVNTPVAEKKAYNPSLDRDNDGFRWRVCVSAFVFAGICYLLFPKGLSWLRTLFYAYQWNSSQSAFKAFLLCAGIAILLYMVWRLITLYWYQRNKKSLIPLIADILLLCFIAITTSQIIDKNIQTRKEDLDLESDIIKTVLVSAEQPVYAMERAEFYQRSIGGLDERIMTPEDICRDQKGTILTDKSREMIWATSLGAKYLQFSESSGMYSFDPAVIEATTAAGYEWKGFYSSERTCDLQDLAELNHLQLNGNGSLILDGPDHSLAENRYMDQVRTNYEVRFSLNLDDKISDDYDDIACVLYVTGYAGEETLVEQEVSRSEFDENGHCMITIPYACPFMPRMEYLVIAADGVTLYVDEIAWRRVA